MDKKEFIRRIAEKRDISKEDFSLIPDEVIMTRKYTLICKYHGPKTSYGHSLLNHECRFCVQRRNGIKIKDFLEKSDKNHSTNLVYLFKNEDLRQLTEERKNNEYLVSDDRLVIVCPIHGKYERSVDVHLRTQYDCPKCAFEQTRTGYDEFVRLSKLKHGDAYDYSVSTDYTKADALVTIRCFKHGLFRQNAFTHYHKGTICPKCSKDRERLGLEAFLEKATQIHSGKYNYKKIKDLPSTSIMVKIICPYHGTFIQRASSHLDGCGCPTCGKNVLRKTTEQFINESKALFPNKYTYEHTNYISNKHKLIITCIRHGPFEVTPNQHLSHGISCPKCSSSFGEILLRLYLNKYGIAALEQHRIWTKHRFDFVIPDAKILIEFDGKQHFEPTEAFGGIESFNRLKRNDRIKTDLSKLTGYDLIRFNYKQIRILEKALIKKLIKCRKYWFSIDGIVYAFKDHYEIADRFSLPILTTERKFINQFINKFSAEKVFK
jgi:hypothetical protein